LALVEQKCRELGVNAVLAEHWAKGGEGALALAEEVTRVIEQSDAGVGGSDISAQAAAFSFSYPLDISIEEKIEAIATRIYHADGVDFTAQAKTQAAKLTELGFAKLPVCMAKTQYSFADNPALLGAPRDFRVTVRNLKVSAGAGFIVALTGDIMTMPGLPKVPSAEKIDVDASGKISGLF
jgi:formate--tetrahydrofolate ligase